MFEKVRELAQMYPPKAWLEYAKHYSDFEKGEEDEKTRVALLGYSALSAACYTIRRIGELDPETLKKVYKGFPS